MSSEHASVGDGLHSHAAGARAPFRSISVITVCLNHLHGLVRTWESLREQHAEDFAWIVIDGGSDDGTVDFLANLDDRRLRWLSEPDRGIFDAMNKGLRRARGRYVWFLNAGDTIPRPTVLGRLLDAIEVPDDASEPDLVYGDSLQLVGAGEPVLRSAWPPSRIWYGMFTHHQAMLFRRASLDGLEHELRFDVGADYAMVARLLERGATTRYVDEALCVFEGGGYSIENEPRGLREQFVIRREILGLPWVAAAGITLWKYAMWVFKKLFPGLYESIRYREIGS